MTTGRFGFRTYDVTDPRRRSCWTRSSPPEILGANGYWQDEDMELDSPQADHRGARPAPRRRRSGELPGHRHVGTKTRNPGCRSGFYVISYADPANLTQIGDFVELPAGHTTSCIEDCDYVWTGGPARRDDLAYLGPFTPGARGDGRPIWVTEPQGPGTSGDVPEADRPWPQRRLTDYSHDVDVDANGIAWASGRGGLLGYATRGKWRDPVDDRVRRPSRGTRSSSRAAASGGAERRGSAADGLHPQRGAAARRQGPRLRGGGRQHRADDRGGLHRPLRSGRADRRRGHHRLARRRAGRRTRRRGPVPDDAAGRVPPDAQRARHPVAERTARRTTSRCRARRSRPPGTTRASA